MKEKAYASMTDLLSKPMFRDAVRRRMSKLERKLNLLASIYFDEKITIIYAKGTPKIDRRNTEVEK